jgi:autotransporter-associated beta strand protein
MKPRSVFRSAILAGSALGAAGISQAQTWTGGTDASWNTGTNWSTNAVPITTGDVLFDGTGANFNIILSAPGPLQSLTFTAGQTAAVNLNTTAGSSSPLVAAANLVFGTTATALTVEPGSGDHKVTGTGVSSGGTLRDLSFIGSLTSFTFDIGSGASFEINGRVGGGTINAKYTKSGTGTLIFSGPNGGASAWQFNGANAMFNVNEGVVRFANGGAYGNSGNKYTVAGGAAIELTGGFNQTLNAGTLTLNGTGTGSDGALRSVSGNNAFTVSTGGGGVALASDTTIGVDADTFTLNPVLSGAGNLTKAGAGTLVLTGANTLSGSTTVSAGTLELRNNLALQNSALVTTSAGIVILDPLVTTPTFGGLSGASGDLATILSSGYSGITALTLNPGTGSSVSYGGAIADGVAGTTLTKSGAGTQILTGTNTYTGATTLSAGVLSVGTTANLGAPSSNLVMDGGTLQITGNTLGSVSGIGHAVSFNPAKNVGLDIQNPAHRFTVDQELNQSTGTFTKLGPGTAIFNQPNSYTGATDISGGTLVLANADAIPSGNLVRFSTTAGSGVLQLSTDTPVTPFNISGSTNHPGTIVSDRATPGDGITHALGSANIGNNTYNFTSGPNVTGGMAGITIASMTVGAGANGTTVLNPTTADLTITGSVTPINANLKTLHLAGTSSGNSIGGAVADAGPRTVTLIKSNTGTWTLNGPNAYSGNTTVNEGVLTLANAPDPLNANPANDASTVTIADTGATLDLTFAGTDKVDKLFIGSTQMAAGEYGPSATPLAQITGSGTLTVATGPAGFSGWITGTFANGTVPPGEQGPNDDPDRDGIRNLVEYAIAGQDPTVANPDAGSFANNLLSFDKRQPLAADITYAIKESTDLGNLDDWTEVSGGTYLNNPTTISYELTPPAPVKNFIRLEVTQNP